MSPPYSTDQIIHSLLMDVERSKSAADSAEANREQTDTSHASGIPASDTESASTGQRASENEADVKDLVGPAAVDAQPEATASTGAPSGTDVGPQVNAKQSPTGGDPATEKNIKENRDDPGTTSHPADLDKLKEKYASAKPAELQAAMAKCANELCATIQLETSAAKSAKAAEKPAAKPAAQPKAASAQTAAKPEEAAKAGWDAAGSLMMDKSAADQLVHAKLCQILTEAITDSDDALAALGEYTKSAEEEEEGGEKKPEEHAEPDGDEGGADPLNGLGTGSMGGDAGAGGGEAGGGETEKLVEMLTQLLGGAGGMDAGGAGGDPMAAAGGDAGGLPTGDVGEPDMAQISELLNALNGAGGADAAGGGMPPDMGGGPKMAKAAAAKGSSTKKAAQNLAQGYLRHLINKSRA